MPLTESYGALLGRQRLTILPQTGYGWGKFTSEGCRSEFVPKKELLFVENAAKFRPEQDILGFTGTVRSSQAELDGLAVVALTHTTEFVSEAEPTPLLLVMSPHAPELVRDNETLLGYLAVPQGYPAFAGYGLLAPPDLSEK